MRQFRNSFKIIVLPFLFVCSTMVFVATAHASTGDGRPVTDTGYRDCPDDWWRIEINPSPDGKQLKIHHDCGAHTKVLREHAGRVAQIKFDAKNRKEVLDVIEQAIESSQ